MTTKFRLAALVFFLTIAAPGTFNAETKITHSLDSAKSKIEIQVAKDGFFKAFGHDHLVATTHFSGDVQFTLAKVENSSVSFTADADSLRVIDPGESEKDRIEVQATMLGEQVLDVARYPQIQFSSSAVKVVSASKNTFDLQVSGTLTLHGTQKSVALPYKAAGGAVKVKDKLKLTFHIVATKAASSAN